MPFPPLASDAAGVSWSWGSCHVRFDHCYLDGLRRSLLLRHRRRELSSSQKNASHFEKVLISEPLSKPSTGPSRQSLCMKIDSQLLRSIPRAHLDHSQAPRSRVSVLFLRRLQGQGWHESSQQPIRQPAPLWASVANAHLLGSTTLRGRPVWEIAFFDPTIPAWFTIWVDKATARTLELRMTAAQHFMHQVYGPFDMPLQIVPPTKAAP